MVQEQLISKEHITPALFPFSRPFPTSLLAWLGSNR